MAAPFLILPQIAADPSRLGISQQVSRASREDRFASCGSDARQPKHRRRSLMGRKHYDVPGITQGEFVFTG
jgi:hypothetical protein